MRWGTWRRNPAAPASETDDLPPCHRANGLRGVQAQVRFFGFPKTANVWSGDSYLRIIMSEHWSSQIWPGGLRECLDTLILVSKNCDCLNRGLVFAHSNAWTWILAYYYCFAVLETLIHSIRRSQCQICENSCSRIIMFATSLHPRTLYALARC